MIKIGDGQIGWPKVFLTLVPLLSTGIIAIIVWVWTIESRMTLVERQQSENTSNIERLGTLEQRMAQIDARLELQGRQLERIVSHLLPGTAPPR